MKCLYCDKKIAAGSETSFMVNNINPCCCQICKDKAIKSLSKYEFKWDYLWIPILISIIAFLINDLTIMLSYFNYVLSICWGAFLILLSYISKPIFSTCIKNSILISRILGLVIVINSIISIILYYTK